MTHSELIKEIEKNQVHPAYLFVGTEDYLVDHSLKRLSEKIVDPASREFNYDVFYASQADAGKIIDAASAYPMLAERRLVIVKEAQKLPASGLDLISKYLEKPSPTTSLVLVADKFNARAKSNAKVKARSCFVEFKPLYDNKIPGWIKSYIGRQGYEIDYNATLLIQAHIGNNLRAIVNEIEKIKLNIDAKKITEQDVQRVVGLSRTYSIFNLNDAIGNKELDKALLILNKMLDVGESHTAILAMISRLFSNLLKVKGAIKQNKSQNEIAALSGIPPYFIDKTIKMTQKYKAEQFTEIFERLLETDIALKTSRQTPEIALQTMLLQILK